MCFYGDRTKKEIYLSFDDGPTEYSTIAILDLLDEYDAKASFFCLGESVLQYPELFGSIKSRGHTIGNHGFYHYDGWKSSKEQYVHNANQGALRTSSGLLRPPYGHLNPLHYFSLKEKHDLVFWDIMPGDFEDDATSAQIGSRLLKATEGSIIVLHDRMECYERFAEPLAQFIQEYKAQGYEFKAMEPKAFRKE
ncbi:polysaccharide deacetylase family protein [Chitinophagales bacterium]|nr:polysaccharide deacetylase family protein [Chitinophagales bacterium]